MSNLAAVHNNTGSKAGQRISPGNPPSQRVIIHIKVDQWETLPVADLDLEYCQSDLEPERQLPGSLVRHYLRVRDQRGNEFLLKYKISHRQLGRLIILTDTDTGGKLLLTFKTVADANAFLQEYQKMLTAEELGEQQKIIQDVKEERGILPCNYSR